MFSLSPYEWCNQPTKTKQTNKKKTESVETFEVIEIVK